MKHTITECSARMKRLAYTVHPGTHAPGSRANVLADVLQLSMPYVLFCAKHNIQTQWGEEEINREMLCS